MKCQNCGTENNEEYQFCKNCGAVLPKSNPKPSTENMVNNNGSGNFLESLKSGYNKDKHEWILIIVVVVIVCIAGAFLASNQYSNQSAVSTDSTSNANSNFNTNTADSVSGETYFGDGYSVYYPSGGYYDDTDSSAVYFYDADSNAIGTVMVSEDTGSYNMVDMENALESEGITVLSTSTTTIHSTSYDVYSCEQDGSYFTYYATSYNNQIYTVQTDDDISGSDILIESFQLN